MLFVNVAYNYLIPFTVIPMSCDFAPVRFSHRAYYNIALWFLPKLYTSMRRFKRGRYHSLDEVSEQLAVCGGQHFLMKILCHTGCNLIFKISGVIKQKGGLKRKSNTIKKS